MLAGLARWLRAAGHDTVMADPGSSDAEVLELGSSEERTVLTLDQRLAASGGRRTMLLPDDLDAQAAFLRDRLRLDWLEAPFTRCLVDNAKLRCATAAEIGAFPCRTQELPGPFRTCPCCKRSYWPGSHVRRMLARLELWQTR